MPSEPTLKGLPTAPEVALFRVIDAVIRADPVIRSVVKTIRSWEGKATDRLPFAAGDAPAIRLTPRGSPEQPWTPQAMTGWLFIDVEILVTGFCSDDIANLWSAVKRAVNPGDFDGMNALTLRLQDAKAHKGLVQFSAPAFDAQGGDDGTFLAVAQMKIEYRAPFYS